MHKFKLAILIPTFNNSSIIRTVIEDVKSVAKDIIIIIVNDGSTDKTEQILQNISGIELISYKDNCGKGLALQKGFRRASELGVTNVITFDGDGQHLVKDLPVFLNATEENPKSLFIGNRILFYGKGVTPPSRSSLGRKFGNFWYKFITRLILNDTQCGFRSYPLQRVLEINSKRKKYEYEQELLIKLAWNGVSIKELPIHIYYQPKEETMSHFRPFRDFIHISRVNARYAFIRIVNPFLFLDVPGKNWKEKIVALVKHELRGNISSEKAALSISLGIFYGLSPIHGFQVVSALGSAVLLRLNKPLTFLGVSISSAPMLPFIIALEIIVGKYIVPVRFFAMNSKMSIALYNGTVFVVGAMIVATISSVLSFVLLKPILKKMSIIRAHKKMKK